MKRNARKRNADTTNTANTTNTHADQAHTNDTNEQTTATPFADLLRSFERAYASGDDYTNELLALATACAQSVLKKCIDPQRKSATERETVSAVGLSPALTAVKRGIVADLRTLDNIRTASNASSMWHYDDDGYVVTKVIDPDADKAVTALIHETLSDGLDIVNAAAVAILEQAADHAAGAGWMETPYTLRRLSRKVLIKSEDSAKWEDVETSPIREVYRAVRREVQNSRAMQTDPRNGYLYIEDVTADPDSDKLETIYRRLNKWADLGGFTHDGHYTADAQTVADYENVLELLNLSDRQATVIKLRMSGYGLHAIGTYLGVDHKNIQRTLKQVAAKAEKIGFTPSMWAEMTAAK